MSCCDLVYLPPKNFIENFTSISLGIVAIEVIAVVLILNLIQLSIAMTLLMLNFDTLYIHILLEIFTLMLLAFQAVAIEVVVGAILIVVVEQVNVAVVGA